MSWLLDHPDVHVTELSDADTVSDEYSDEEVLEELEEAEPAFSVVSFYLFPAHLSTIQTKLDPLIYLCIFFVSPALACWCSGDGKPNL